MDKEKRTPRLGNSPYASGLLSLGSAPCRRADGQRGVRLPAPVKSSALSVCMRGTPTCPRASRVPVGASLTAVLSWA